MDLLEVLRGFEVILVDVRCDVDELERRERTRGDRPPGLAASQQVFAHADRDFAVDTTTATPTASAEAVVNFLATSPRPEAFSRLREKLLDP
jgi:chloramphenicol 3-O phosphotransferase